MLYFYIIMAMACSFFCLRTTPLRSLSNRLDNKCISWIHVSICILFCIHYLVNYRKTGNLRLTEGGEIDWTPGAVWASGIRTWCLMCRFLKLRNSRHQRVWAQDASGTLPGNHIGLASEHGRVKRTALLPLVCGCFLIDIGDLLLKPMWHCLT